MAAKISDKVLDRMFSQFNGNTVLVYVVRHEVYQENLYDHWWQGWVTVGKTDADYVAEALLGTRASLFGVWSDKPSRVRPIRPGPRLLDSRRTVTRYRDVEVDDPRESTVTTTGGGLELAPVYWGDPWPNKGAATKSLPDGTYTAIRVRDMSGELLFEAPMTSTYNLKAEDSFNLGDIQMSVS